MALVGRLLDPLLDVGIDLPERDNAVARSDGKFDVLGKNGPVCGRDWRGWVPKDLATTLAVRVVAGKVSGEHVKSHSASCLPKVQGWSPP